MADYPFRFYGLKPSDWYDDGEGFEARFRERPNAAARQKIAAAMASIPEASATSWLWADDWVYLDSHRLDGDFFLALHAAHPLIEVVCLHAREHSERDAWSTWSLEQQDVPSAAPEWDPDLDYTVAVYSEEQERFAVEAETDDAFNQALRSLSERASEARNAAAGPRELRLVRWGMLPANPLRESPPDSVVHSFPHPALIFRAANDVFVGLPKKRDRHDENAGGLYVVVGTEGEARPVTMGAFRVGPHAGVEMAFTANGERCYTTGAQELLCVDTRTLSVTPIGTGLYGEALDLSPDERWLAVGNSDGVTVVALPSQASTHHAIEGIEWVTFVAGGRGLVAGIEAGLALFAVVDGALHFAAKVALPDDAKPDAGELFSIGTHVVWHGRDDQFELENAVNVIDAARDEVARDVPSLEGWDDCIEPRVEPRSGEPSL